MEHDLNQAFFVTHVDENHTAVIAAAVNPAAQSNGFIKISCGQLTAKMATHTHSYILFKSKWL
jgi:hypothetical protein